jgi:alpha-1,6-mannosyltransferase
VLFLNGLEVSVDGLALRGEPPDRGLMRLQFGAYVAATLSLFALYAGLLRLVWLRRVSSRAGVALAAVAFPVLFHALLFLAPPTLSIDLSSYVAHGTIAAELDGNPYLEPTEAALASPAGRELVREYGWEPVHSVTPYGPLWTQLESLAVGIAGDAPGAVRLLKLVVVLASLATGALVWAILGRVRPEAQLLGTTAYLWNPLILAELAGEGHNDALMTALVLAGLTALVAARPGSSVPLGALAVLTKYLPAALLPPQAVYAWRSRSSTRRLGLELLAGGAVAAVVTVVLYRPFWAGLATFDGLRESAERSFVPSTSGAVFHALSAALSDEAAARATGLALGGAFAAYVLVRSAGVRDVPSLLRACAGTAVVYTLVAAPIYWPWYPALAVALLALSPGVWSLALIVALSLGSRLVAPLEVIRENGFLPWSFQVWVTTAVAVAAPLLVFVLGGWAQRRTRGRDDPGAAAGPSGSAAGA